MSEKNLQISLLCDTYGALLPPKQCEALKMYYDDDLSLAEIAENTGISRQGVRDQIKHAENKLLAYEQILGLTEKMRALSEQLENMAKLPCAESDVALMRYIEDMRKLLHTDETE